MELKAKRTLIILSIAELLAMSLWFAGTAVLPQLAQIWKADLGVSAWLTLAVQLGFVVGALLLATFNISDVFHAPRVLAVSAVAGALFNAGFAFTADHNIALAIILRFLTGATLAGTYPTGMKILAGWFRQGRGLALGILVGALAIGSALPHGVNAVKGIGAESWRLVVLSSSVLALIAAALVAFFVNEGPYAAASPPFEFRQVTEILSFRNRRLGLANLGYLGHMWELYSLWGWVALLLRQSAIASDAQTQSIKALSFMVIAVGSIGCWWAGHASDRAVPNRLALISDHQSRVRQRSRVTIIAMGVSGICCLLTAALFRHFYIVVAISIIWGISVVADSAQFSAIISEVSDPRYVGTALTLQTAMGFLLTVISIRLTAAIGERAGWQWAAASLAIGPAMGIWAMVKLNSASE
ncbi:MAG: transporter [Acidobacteriales bacterium]|nr:transporter [Terriglobales bacterium]